eukprot:CAMPEP_0198425146 /NCGR_PEP_ID=MMETSP1452-20131203/4356_1 /TAXON_ID=1181717 /ORGANISM="Synchroma pusillum, Strain CCMP3072" /LENGTH=70 /DNA_ID=CAMNT_0044145499 /DNA_START=16 /DNA_END=224 /DNA_ORIENTATION=-
MAHAFPALGPVTALRDDDDPPSASPSSAEAYAELVFLLSAEELPVRTIAAGACHALAATPEGCASLASSG